MQGQIYKIHSDLYSVQMDGKTFECKVREVLKKQKERIVVGDFVEFDNGVISKILPKKHLSLGLQLQMLTNLLLYPL